MLFLEKINLFNQGSQM